MYRGKQGIKRKPINHSRKISVGQKVRIKLPGLFRKGAPRWSKPTRIIEVLKQSVRVEGGGLWNLRRVAVYPDSDEAHEEGWTSKNNQNKED